MARFQPSLQPFSCHRVVWRLSSLLILAGGVFATNGVLASDDREAAAPQGQRYVVAVPVVSAKPIEVIRRVARPEKTCELVRDARNYSRSHRRHSSYDREPRNDRGGVGSQLLGGIIGGAIGNQFGGGNGKKALTIAGALIGSSIARGDRHRYDDRYASRNRDIEPEYECRTITRTREVTDVTGYDVTYRYNNTLYSRRMDYDPGDTLELRIRATPELAPTSHANTLAES